MDLTTPSPECKNLTGIMNATTGFEKTVTSGQAMLIMVLFGCFCAMLAKVLVMLRVRVFKDKANVDRTFDAGGQLSMGLTAATIVSEWTWANAFGQSSNAGVKYGLAGVYWYAAGATVQILLFSMICIELKIRAPGAKTYMQLIRTRFGTVAHLTFCVYGLVTNFIVTSLLVFAGGAVLTRLVQGMSVEFASTMILLVIGSFCFIGGVRATSYVSYFTTMLMLVGVILFMFRVFHFSSPEMKDLGSVETVYKLVTCSTAGEPSNYQSSFLTIYSPKAFKFGIVKIIVNLGSVFMDQAYWQRSVAAKPREGTWGFISAGLVYFAIPFTFATTMGLAYVSLGTLQGGPLLQPAEVEDGLVPAVVAGRLLGHSGEILIILLLFLAVSSTGAAEIMAMVAILIYDIYGVYLKPYRTNVEWQKCLLCEKSRSEDVDNSMEMCNCESMTSCVACGEDERERNSSKQALKPMFKCRMHGKYRAYNEYLDYLKDWAIVIVTLLILPITIFLKVLEAKQTVVYQFMGVLISSGVCPLCLSMCWKRQTGKGLVAGLLTGTACGLVAWLVHASLQEGGLSQKTFMENTGKIEVMLSGNCVSIFTGLVVCVVISLMTPPEGDPNMVWRHTLDIDNPLSPWTEIYAEELNLTGANRLNNRPPLSKMSQVFRLTRISTLIGSTSATALILVFGPLVMLSISTFSYTQFFNWVVVIHIWVIAGAIYIIFMPLLTEFRDLYKAMTGRNITFNGIQRFFESDGQALENYTEDSQRRFIN